MNEPEVISFFDIVSNTVTYVVVDPETKACAIIDSILDYDASSGRTSTKSADVVVDFIHQNGLKTQWVLETHPHADHFSAAPYLQEKLGGLIAIGEHIRDIQETFGRLFNPRSGFKADGSQFGKLFADEEIFSIGNLEAKVIHVPGHTAACVAYYIGDAVFVGDTLFMPDFGSARCDFPGGDAGKLFDSIQKLYALPDMTRVFVGHDYKSSNRNHFQWETTLNIQKTDNIHINSSVPRETFIEMRNKRDKTLKMPKLTLPSMQVNMRAGEFPEPEDNGIRYLKIPLNSI